MKDKPRRKGICTEILSQKNNDTLDKESTFINQIIDSIIV